MNLRFDTERLSARRRPFEELEAELVRRHIADRDHERAPLVDAIRYAMSFARLTEITTVDGNVVDFQGVLGRHAVDMLELIKPRMEDKRNPWGILRIVPELNQRTMAARKSALEYLPLDRESLEAEVTQRVLAIASGGGGGAGYVFAGAYDAIDRAGIQPSLMVGTSIGALMSIFRARRKRFDLAALVAAARALSWSKVFRVLETQNKYGLPAALRLYLRTALGDLFQSNGRPLRIEEMEIPFYSVCTGITVDALKHDLDYYEHLIADEIHATTRSVRARSGLKAMNVLREFMSNRDALVEIVLGRAEGTQAFDVLDAAGFSAAIPGVIHYDVIRPDERMHKLLDSLYAAYGITRLGEGGMVSNVPARIAWESVVGGLVGPRRNVLVAALDCFAPSRRRIAWYPFMEAVRQANVRADLRWADEYVRFPKILSPVNLVPSVSDLIQTIRWGREATESHTVFLQEMMRKLPVLRRH